jgi:hypothetical protein
MLSYGIANERLKMEFVLRKLKELVFDSLYISNSQPFASCFLSFILSKNLVPPLCSKNKASFSKKCNFTVIYILLY